MSRNNKLKEEVLCSVASGSILTFKVNVRFMEGVSRALREYIGARNTFTIDI